MEKAYKETMFIIEFISGKQKRFDDDRFRMDWSDDHESFKVYSRITGDIVLDVPCVGNVTYIHHNIIKKGGRQNYSDTPDSEEHKDAEETEAIDSYGE